METTEQEYWEKWRAQMIRFARADEAGRKVVCLNFAGVVGAAFLGGLTYPGKGEEYERVANIVIDGLNWLAKDEEREVVRITKPPFAYELKAKGQEDAG